MDIQLDSVETRVIGCLMEKEAATPDYYPLSLNALVNACNQKSNREPVVSYDDATVEEAIESLRAKGMAVRITGGDSRVPKYGHRLAEVFNFGRRESAVMCVLMLRGPQTAGEIRGRAERMYAFDDLEAVESCLERLMEWPSGPLVRKLQRYAGSREPRFGQLLSGDIEVPASETAQRPVAAPGEDRIVRLEEAVEEMRRDLAALREELARFRSQFE